MQNIHKILALITLTVLFSCKSSKNNYSSTTAGKIVTIQNDVVLNETCVKNLSKILEETWEVPINRAMYEKYDGQDRIWIFRFEVKNSDVVNILRFKALKYAKWDNQLRFSAHNVEWWQPENLTQVAYCQVRLDNGMVMNVAYDKSDSDSAIVFYFEIYET